MKNIIKLRLTEPSALLKLTAATPLLKCSSAIRPSSSKAIE